MDDNGSAPTLKEAEELISRLAPTKAWWGGDPTVVGIAELVSRPTEEVQQELDLIRAERRLAELEEQRSVEARRLQEIVAAKEAANKAKQGPDDSEERRQTWLERQQMHYERGQGATESGGWAAIDAADDEKPVKKRNLSQMLIYVVIALFASCLLLQVLVPRPPAAKPAQHAN